MTAVLTDDEVVVIEQTDEPVPCMAAGHTAHVCLDDDHPAEVSGLWTCGCGFPYCVKATTFYQNWAGVIHCPQCRARDVRLLMVVPL